MTGPNFFSSGSPFLHHPLLTPERTDNEVSFILAQTRLSTGEKILDIGCGPGRHVIELAQRGYQAVGIDPSASMIKTAKQRAKASGVEPQFHLAYGEDYSPEDKFEAAICLFSTLGQINTEDEKPPPKTDHPLLKHTANILTPGGIFILEIPNKEWMLLNLKKSERFGDENQLTVIRRDYDDTNSIVTETFTLISPEETRKYLLRYYLFNPPEIHSLLENAGFTVTGTYGDFNYSHLTATSENIIKVARLSG